MKDIPDLQVTDAQAAAFEAAKSLAAKGTYSPIYEGTVPEATIARRRARNRAAKASRKRNRGR